MTPRETSRRIELCDNAGKEINEPSQLDWVQTDLPMHENAPNLQPS